MHMQILFALLIFTLFDMSTPLKPEKSLQFFSTVGKLKYLKRTGWVNHEVPQPESVADHMYRMSMLSFLITDPAVNKDHLMKICLVHDLAESIVGDITPYDGVTKEEKRKLEETALNQIVTDLQHDEIAQEISSLWLEYEEGVTIDAQIASQLDKFEMILQADEYEIKYNKILQSFFDSTRSYFTHPEIQSWAEELLRKRSLRLNTTTTTTTTTTTDK